MKRLILIAMLLLVAGAAPVLADAAAEERLAARSFQLEFRDASRAAVVIKPLISASGSVSIQPSANTLVVTDSPEALREIARVLAEYDAPAKEFSLEIRLVGASRVANPPPVPEGLREISSKLSGVLRFNRFDQIGQIRASGREGDPLVVDLGETHRADFEVGEFDPVTRSLQLTDFRLLRVPETSGELQTVFHNATLNLKAGQTVVLGVARDPQSKRLLMLVLVADSQ
ncbi:MAG: secretin N-terminal domain-containing protein [Thermoanaerobaculia bacterium]